MRLGELENSRTLKFNLKVIQMFYRTVAVITFAFENIPWQWRWDGVNFEGTETNEETVIPISKDDLYYISGAGDRSEGRDFRHIWEVELSRFGQQ